MMRDPAPGARVQGSGFRVQGSGFRVQGSGYRVQCSGFRVQGSVSRGASEAGAFLLRTRGGMSAERQSGNQSES